MDLVDVSKLRHRLTWVGTRRAPPVCRGPSDPVTTPGSKRFRGGGLDERTVLMSDLQPVPRLPIGAVTSGFVLPACRTVPLDPACVGRYVG